MMKSPTAETLVRLPNGNLIPMRFFVRSWYHLTLQLLRLERHLQAAKSGLCPLAETLEEMFNRRAARDNIRELLQSDWESPELRPFMLATSAAAHMSLRQQQQPMRDCGVLAFILYQAGMMTRFDYPSDDLRDTCRAFYRIGTPLCRPGDVEFEGKMEVIKRAMKVAFQQ